MADQKNPVPAKQAPANAAPVRRNPGWCLGELPEGKTAQDMTQRERQASAIAHENKWKKRYGQQGVVENPWTRG